MGGLKAAEQYLNICGKIQMSYLFPSQQRRALPAVMGWEMEADEAPMKLIELNWFKAAYELNYFHWMEAKTYKREI